jgi:hypothetical protein
MTRRTRSKLWIPAACSALAFCLASGITAARADEMPPPATPAELVATYSSLADAILATKKTEANLVRSILGTTYGHAQAEVGRAHQAMKSGDAKAAQAAVETVAALVGQIATEGDSAVAAIRKRLLDGGHHHNAKGETQGIYDEGFVVVTRAAKTALLDSSKAIGALSKAPNDASLDAEWKKVQAQYSALMK